MGSVSAVFKADGDETRGRYSISEWWLEPYTRGPGAHSHEEDDDVSVPGDFEPHMQGIAEWFRARSAADSRTANTPRRAKPKRRASSK
jgi:hypothetical protein